MERLQASPKRVTLDLSLQIEFAAAHEEMALGIGADKTAFLVEKLRAADWTKVPPVFLFLFICLGRIGSIHDFSPRNDGGKLFSIGKKFTSAIAKNFSILAPSIAFNCCSVRAVMRDDEEALPKHDVFL
jgi:hypothetical protein